MRKKVSIVAAAGAAAVVAVALLLVWPTVVPPPRSPRIINLVGVDVKFVGSGANATVLTSQTSNTGARRVGEDWNATFSIQVPYEVDCSPHIWNVSQVVASAEPNQSAFVLTKAEWEYSHWNGTGEKSGFPVLLPNCVGVSQSLNGITVYYSYEIVDQGSSDQTLSLAVTVALWW